MPESDPEPTEARLSRELAEMSETTRTRVILGALSLASFANARRSRTDTIAAAGATVVAVISLFLALDQTRTQRRQLGAAVWPSVRVSYSNLKDPEHPAYELDLVNGGVGPARIQSFTIHWRGEPVTRLAAWAKAACPLGAATWTFGTQTDTILSPGAQTMILAHPRGSSDDDGHCIEEIMLHDVTTDVCYCSVLDECWTASGYSAPTPVHDCRAARRVPQFQNGE